MSTYSRPGAFHPQSRNHTGPSLAYASGEDGHLGMALEQLSHLAKYLQGMGKNRPPRERQDYLAEAVKVFESARAHVLEAEEVSRAAEQVAKAAKAANKEAEEWKEEYAEVVTHLVMPTLVQAIANDMSSDLLNLGQRPQPLPLDQLNVCVHSKTLTKELAREVHWYASDASLIKNRNIIAHPDGLNGQFLKYAENLELITPGWLAATHHFLQGKKGMAASALAACSKPDVYNCHGVSWDPREWDDHGRCHVDLEELVQTSRISRSPGRRPRHHSYSKHLTVPSPRPRAPSQALSVSDDGSEGTTDFPTFSRDSPPPPDHHSDYDSNPHTPINVNFGPSRPDSRRSSDLQPAAHEPSQAEQLFARLQDGRPPRVLESATRRRDLTGQDGSEPDEGPVSLRGHDPAGSMDRPESYRGWRGWYGRGGRGRGRGGGRGGGWGRRGGYY